VTLPEQTPPDRPILDDRALAAVVYVLYLIALGTAFTTLIGFVVAYMVRPQADENTRTHFTFQMRTVLIGLAYVVRRRHPHHRLGWLAHIGMVVSLEPGPQRQRAACANRRQPIQNPNSWMFG